MSNQARMFDAFIVTPIRIFFGLIFIGTAYAFAFRRTWDKWRMSKIQASLRGHIVVAGFGTSGSEAVDELMALGVRPQDMVVIDRCAEALERPVAGLRDRRGRRDARQDAAGGPDRGRAGDDRQRRRRRHLDPNHAHRPPSRAHLTISVAVRNEDNELLARQAGATTVINPVSFAGLLPGSTHGAHIADYIADLASSSGRVRLAERVVTDAECGKPLSALARGLGVRIYRVGRPYGFWEPKVQALMAGDCIVEILPTATTEAEA